jgi:plastocyanin
VEAAVGDTLVWSNADVVPHTAMADGGGWDTGSIPAGGEGRVVVRG